MRSEPWGADTDISMPTSDDPEQPTLVPLGGFGFGAGGITFNASEADLEEYRQPHFAPPPGDGDG